MSETGWCSGGHNDFEAVPAVSWHVCENMLSQPSMGWGIAGALGQVRLVMDLLRSGRILMTNFADRTIWTGDNLEILRGINSESVDLIYLDPPFNSNRNYAAPVGSSAAGAAFKDTWTLSDLDVAWMGLIADEQPAMYKVLEAARLTHGKGMQSYLCMMAVRLLEMRRVLKDSGSIYLHCDPTASHYLKLLMDSIFGAGNFMAEITWKRTSAHGDSRTFGNVADVILFYGDQININDVRVPYDPAYIFSLLPLR